MKYQIVYADPPWHYNDKRNTHTRFCGGAAAHYQTMDYKTIANIPVSDITDQNAILFLWATYPCLKEALFVMEAWGFEYKTIGFNWVKANSNNMGTFFGIGYYTKSNSEPCLIGVKGRPRVVDNSVPSILFSPRQSHSRKPTIVRERIVQLMGDLPRIELFARNKVDGWDAWGNEIKSDVVFKDEGI